MKNRKDRSVFTVFFSMLNLVNTSMTNVIFRRKEMGLLRAVGMDGRQLSHMIGFENAFQILGSFAVSLVCGRIIGKALCAAVGKISGFSFVDDMFPVVPVLLYAGLVFLLQFALTKWAGMYCRRNSAVEQIRVTEKNKFKKKHFKELPGMHQFIKSSEIILKKLQKHVDKENAECYLSHIDISTLIN